MSLIFMLVLAITLSCLADQFLRVLGLSCRVSFFLTGASNAAFCFPRASRIIFHFLRVFAHGFVPYLILQVWVMKTVVTASDAFDVVGCATHH